jgi:hypothetical protein
MTKSGSGVGQISESYPIRAIYNVAQTQRRDGNSDGRALHQRNQRFRMINKRLHKISAKSFLKPSKRFTCVALLGCQLTKNLIGDDVSNCTEYYE